MRDPKMFIREHPTKMDDLRVPSFIDPPIFICGDVPMSSDSATACATTHRRKKNASQTSGGEAATCLVAHFPTYIHDYARNFLQ